MKLGFSRQHNRKAEEGSKHPDRNAQFGYINASVVAVQAKQQPVISVDTKKKELVGNFKNAGSDYRPEREPMRVNVHDFEDKELGKVVPYGVYYVGANEGLMPASRRVNQHLKRDRLPSGETLAAARDAIVDWWETAWLSVGKPHRRTEADR